MCIGIGIGCAIFALAVYPLYKPYLTSKGK